METLGERRRMRNLGDRHVDHRIRELLVVSHPHRQPEGTRVALEGLARADVEHLPAHPVHREEVRCGAGLDAVTQRVTVRVRCRHPAQRHPIHASVPTLRQREGVARLSKRRGLRRVGDRYGDRGMRAALTIARPDHQLEGPRAALEILALANVGQLPCSSADFEQSRLVAPVQVVAHDVAVRIRRRNRPQRHPIRAPVRILQEREVVARVIERRRVLRDQPLNFLRICPRRLVGEGIRILSRLLRLHPHEIRPRQQGR